MGRKIPLWIAISISLVLSSVTMVCTMMYASNSYSKLTVATPEPAFPKLQGVADVIAEEFYKDVDASFLENAAIEGFINGLDDKYAHYYTAEETKANSANQKGESVGMGVNFLIHPKTGYMYIEWVHRGSPADAVGLCKGDVVTSIAGTTVTSQNYAQLVQQLKDSAGTAVTISVTKANGTKKTLEIIPTTFTTQSVWYEMIGETAYIYIAEFDDTTLAQLKMAMTYTTEAKNVVFDLRGNPGGTVRSVCACMDYLLPEGDLVVATYRDGSSKVLQMSDAAAALTVPAVVVVDGDTASSGEVFALALRDIHGAKLVGEKTYGKGVMQTTRVLEDGSSYKFSVATITSHSRTEYNGVGVVPDVTLRPTDDQKTAARMSSVDKDPVIQAALEVLAESVVETE